MNRWF